MGFKGHPVEKAILFIIDAIVLFLGFKTAHWLRFESGWIPLWKTPTPYPIYLKAFYIVFLVGMFLYSITGIYKKEKNLNIYDTFFELIKTNLLYLLLVTLISFYYREILYSRLVVSFYFFFITIYQFIARIILKEIFKIIVKKGKLRKKGIIVGKGEILDALRTRIESKPELGIDIHKILTPSEFLNNKEECNENCVVILAIPFEEQNVIPQIMKKLEGKKVSIVFAPDLYGIMMMGTETVSLDGMPILILKEPGLTLSQRIVKRTFDIIFSSLVLLFLSPLFIIIAIIIKLTSKGPVFYKQERIGKDGKIFYLYKFRTMRVGADKEEKPKFTTPDDPRVTPIGRILRKFSIDEFPQFINVLKGDMSVVGPRPERPYFVEKFKKEIPRYEERHRVKGGITGWAQVHGWRGDTSIEERLRYDLYYIENWSFLLDLKIIFKTIVTFFSQVNAY